MWKTDILVKQCFADSRNWEEAPCYIILIAKRNAGANLRKKKTTKFEDFCRKCERDIDYEFRIVLQIMTYFNDHYCNTQIPNVKIRTKWLTLKLQLWMS